MLGDLVLLVPSRGHSGAVQCGKMGLLLPAGYVTTAWGPTGFPKVEGGDFYHLSQWSLYPLLEWKWLGSDLFSPAGNPQQVSLLPLKRLCITMHLK